MAQTKFNVVQLRVENQENVHISDLFRSDMLYIFNMVLAMYSLKNSLFFFYPNTAYRDSISHALVIVTRYDVGKHLNLGPSGVITKCI